jgi:hypothetical protein
MDAARAAKSASDIVFLGLLNCSVRRLAVTGLELARESRDCDQPVPEPSDLDKAERAVGRMVAHAAHRLIDGTIYEWEFGEAMNGFYVLIKSKIVSLPPGITEYAFCDHCATLWTEDI